MSKTSESVSVVETKQGASTRVRNWAFTVSKPTDVQLIHLEQPPFKDMVDWAVFAIEYGDENDNLHIQGCIRFLHGKTWSAVRKVLGLKAGDELAQFKSTPAANVAYCRKGKQSHAEWDSDGVDGENYGLDYKPLIELGTPPKYGDDKKNQWHDIRDAIELGWSDLEICARWPMEGMKNAAAIANYRLLWDRKHAQWRNVEVVYVWGKTGTGKTRAITEKYGYPNVYRVTNYNSGAFDMYDGQDIIMFEEYRSSFKLEQMLNYLDGHPVELPCRYANQLLKATKIFIVTNIPLNEQYPKFHDGYESEGRKNSWDALNRRITGEIYCEEGVNLTPADLPLLGDEILQFLQHENKELIEV